MSEEKIQSRAFQRAALKSESYRIVGLLCLLAFLMLIAIIRGIVAGQFQLVLAQGVVFAIVIGYEAAMLGVVKRSLLRESDVAPALWILNVLIETQLPTIALVLLIESRYLNPLQALVAPALLVYFFFIILSTLRLNPGLSFLTGLASALGYMAVVVFVLTNPNVNPEAATFPLSIYFVYGILILAGGIVAAFVAGQIRRHVFAALREAELQSKLERVNHDLGIARSIQQGLLPSRSPSLSDFELAGWNQPADQTGGDYFDWQELPGGQLAISLGDATGHGIGPALVMASCRAYARASCLANGEQHALLNRLNTLLAEDLPANQFVTYAVVFLDPANARVEVLSAGHGPILWYKSATGQIENLEAQGIPLGMIGAIKYGRGTEGTLGAGDMLVIVTDGFYEWENPEGEEFGLKRLETVIRDSRDSSATEVIERLRSAVESFCRGTEQKDDLTAVILKRKNGSGMGNKHQHEPRA